MILAAGACWLSQEHVISKDNKATLKWSGLHHYDITQLINTAATYNTKLVVSFNHKSQLIKVKYFNQDHFFTHYTKTVIATFTHILHAYNCLHNVVINMINGYQLSIQTLAWDHYHKITDY